MDMDEAEKILNGLDPFSVLLDASSFCPDTILAARKIIECRHGYLAACGISRLESKLRELENRNREDR